MPARCPARRCSVSTTKTGSPATTRSASARTISTSPNFFVSTLGPARVWCTDRHGGVSARPYDSCNLGDHVGDHPAAVARNREIVAGTRALPPSDQWGWMQQVHGTAVAVLDGPTGAAVPIADALVTRSPELPIAVVTADCAPIVLASDDTIAVVHAGHRGLLGGVIEAALDVMRSVGAGRVRALLGPCVRAPRYEFAPADLAPLVAAFGPGVEARTEWGTTAFDLPAAVKIVLGRAGVHAGDVTDTDVCTHASAEYFSYRRDGVTGRQATIAMLTEAKP